MGRKKPSKTSKANRHNAVDVVDGLPRGIAYEDGFRVLGTPIGFGGAKRAGLQFISQAVGADKKGVDALGLSYDRKLRRG